MTTGLQPRFMLQLRTWATVCLFEYLNSLKMQIKNLVLFYVTKINVLFPESQERRSFSEALNKNPSSCEKFRPAGLVLFLRRYYKLQLLINHS